MTVHVRYLQFTFERTWLNEEVISYLHTKNYEDLSLAVALQERAEDWQVHCDSSGRQITSTWLSSNRAHSIKTVHTLEKKTHQFPLSAKSVLWTHMKSNFKPGPADSREYSWSRDLLNSIVIVFLDVKSVWQVCLLS